jgi:hypothetical protein
MRIHGQSQVAQHTDCGEPPGVSQSLMEAEKNESGSARNPGESVMRSPARRETPARDRTVNAAAPIVLVAWRYKMEPVVMIPETFRTSVAH